MSRNDSALQSDKVLVSFFNSGNLVGFIQEKKGSEFGRDFSSQFRRCGILVFV